jgi:hypothetical protein
MSAAPRLTKEAVLAAVALAAMAAVLGLRLGRPGERAGVPRVPRRPAPATLAPEEVPVARPIFAGLGSAEGLAAADAARRSRRNPFVAEDLWEDPEPLPLPLPPEPPQRRIVPVLSIAGGRAFAPSPPRIASLPAPVAETEEAPR